MKQNEIKRQQIQMLSGVMGCIIFLVFGRILGNSGVTYLGIAYLSIGVVQAMLCGGVSEGLGKFLKARNARGQYRNGAVTQRRILILQGTLGGVASVLFVLGAKVLAENLFQLHYSTVLIRILAVALFFRVVSSVILGGFLGEEKQGLATLLPPIRQIMILVFGLIFAGSLGEYGKKVSDLLGDEAYAAMYAGAGVAAAITLTEMILCMYISFIFMTKPRMYKRDTEEGMKQVDSPFDTLRCFYGTVWLSGLFQLFPILILWLGMFLYRKNTLDGAVFAEQFGRLCGTFLPMCGIPFLTIGVVLMSKHLRKSRLARNGYQNGLHMAVVSSLFFTMYFAVMSGPLAGVFEQGKSSILGGMFAYGSPLILFAVMYFYFSSLLVVFEKKKLLPGVYGLLILVFGIMSSLLLKGSEAGVMALIYAGIISLAVGDILLGFLCCRMLHVRLDWLRTIAIPLGVVAAIGLLCMLLGKLCTPHLGNFITALVSLLITGILNWFLYKKASFY